MSTRSAPLPTVLERIRRHDPDRFRASLLIPASARPAVWALLAFNLEIARVRESVSQPMLGQIRLQWWRDTIDEIYTGRPVRRHEVAQPLADAILNHRLTRTHFDRLLDAREWDLEDEPPATLAALETYLENTSVRLIDLQLEILGVAAPAAFTAAREVGIAWGLLGLVRALPFHAAQGRVLLPMDLITAAGLDCSDILSGVRDERMTALIRSMAAEAALRLRAFYLCRRDLPRQALPALVIAATATQYHRRLQRAGYEMHRFDGRAPDPWAVVRLLWARYS